MSYLQINSFFLGHLNNAENGNYHSKILLALEPSGLVAIINAADTVTAYVVAVEKLKNAIKKQVSTIITDELHAMDAKRDKELMYIINTVRNLAHSPIAIEEIAGRHLMPVVLPYVSIQSHPRGQKTQEISGLIADLTVVEHTTHVEIMRLLPIINQLAASNKEYITMDYERSIDRSEHKSHTLELRVISDDLYKEIVIKANSMEVVATAPIIKDFINHVNAVISTTKTEYNLRMRSHVDEPKPTE